MADNWSDWSDDEDGVEFDRELWTEFNIEIPHVHTFLHQLQTRDDIASANERFNSFYNEIESMREIKVYFSDIVNVYVLE